jgi:hypothetical protein
MQSPDELSYLDILQSTRIDPFAIDRTCQRIEKIQGRFSGYLNECVYTWPTEIPNCGLQVIRAFIEAFNNESLDPYKTIPDPNQWEDAIYPPTEIQEINFFRNRADKMKHGFDHFNMSKLPSPEECFCPYSFTNKGAIMMLNAIIEEIKEIEQKAPKE